MAFATHSRPTTAYIRNTHEEGNLIDEPRFEQHPRFEDVSQIVLPLTDVVVTDEYEVRKEFDDRNVYVRYGGWKNDDVAPPYQGSEWFEILKPSFIACGFDPDSADDWKKAMGHRFVFRESTLHRMSNGKDGYKSYMRNVRKTDSDGKRVVATNADGSTSNVFLTSSGDEVINVNRNWLYLASGDFCAPEDLAKEPATWSGMVPVEIEGFAADTALWSLLRNG